MSTHVPRPSLLSLLIVVGALASATAAPAAPPTLNYPAAARGAVVDDYHGTKVADPYRWMEDLDAPATRTWVTAEAKIAQNYFAGIGERAMIQKRLTELYDFETFGVPFHEGARHFYEHNTGLQGQNVLFVMEGSAGSPKVALDPNTLSKDGSLAVTGYVTGPGGKLLAYGVSVGGSDWTDWRIRDLATGKDLPDAIRWTKYYKPVFTHDGAGLFYSAFPAPPPGDELKVRDLGNALYYHALGTASSADRKLAAAPIIRTGNMNRTSRTTDAGWCSRSAKARSATRASRISTPSISPHPTGR
jgi:prolyl oligopeptidase